MISLETAQEWIVKLNECWGVIKGKGFIRANNLLDEFKDDLLERFIEMMEDEDYQDYNPQQLKDVFATEIEHAFYDSLQPEIDNHIETQLDHMLSTIDDTYQEIDNEINRIKYLTQ